MGLRLGLGVAWAYLVLGEMTGVSKGIGAVMMNGRMLGNVELVMTGMIVIAAAGKLTDYLLLKVYELAYRAEENGYQRIGGGDYGEESRMSAGT